MIPQRIAVQAGIPNKRGEGMLVWQVCLASVCLHIRRKSSCILCVLASRRVCAVPLLPNCSPGLCRFLRVLCSSCSPILLFIIRCTILARRCTVLWCVQFLLWWCLRKKMPMRIRAKGHSMAWKLPGNSNKPERIKSEAVSTLPEPA